MEDIRQCEKLAYIHDKRKAETAKEVIDILDKNLDFKSVLDLGCGTGIYIREFEKIGKEVLGVDGNIDANPPILADLREKHNFGLFDLVFSIEVAEHIEESFTDIYIKNLLNNCRKWLVMTACPPGRSTSEYTKLAHHNEQPLKYWISKIQNTGAIYEGELSKNLQSEFSLIPGMMTWFNHNLMIFRK